MIIKKTVHKCFCSFQNKDLVEDVSYLPLNVSFHLFPPRRHSTFFATRTKTIESKTNCESHFQCIFHIDFICRFEVFTSLPANDLYRHTMFSVRDGRGRLQIFSDVSNTCNMSLMEMTPKVQQDFPETNNPKYIQSYTNSLTLTHTLLRVDCTSYTPTQELHSRRLKSDRHAARKIKLLLLQTYSTRLRFKTYCTLYYKDSPRDEYKR